MVCLKKENCIKLLKCIPLYFYKKERIRTVFETLPKYTQSIIFKPFLISNNPDFQKIFWRVVWNGKHVCVSSTSSSILVPVMVEFWAKS